MLILGESGTGKDLLAQEIHARSPRSGKAYVAVNCAALPETLIESELFGYERGAFTGAAQQKKGKFELASSGTIFLDEIGDMNPVTQAKVLRVLENRTIERLGGTQTIPVDVRVISATHRNLQAEIRNAKFREDLFFRKKTILVTPGGTAIGEFLIREAVKAFRVLRLDDASMVIVSGPKLKAQPESGVYTYGFLPNLQDYVLAADLVITTGGKGTLNEALAAGTPVIAIPPKGHSEAERNAANLGYRHEDLTRLRQLIVEKLALGRLPPHPSGNADAIRILLEFIESRVGSP